MIGRLAGAVGPVGEDWAIVDVGGVGYRLSCSARTLAAMGGTGAAASLLVETFVRDERIVLYGFADRAEQDCFRLLTSVQGVGARVALAILSALPPEALARAVAAQDRAALTRANGVGARLAQRVVSELRDRMGAAVFEDGPPGDPGAGGPAAGPLEDAVSALVNLGYGRSEAHGAVAAAARSLGGDADAAALIRAGLKAMAS